MQPVTANGNGPTTPHAGGATTFAVRGDLDGGSIKPQYCPGDADPTLSGNWEDVTTDGSLTFTGPGQGNFTLGFGNIRWVLSGAGTPVAAVAFAGAIGRVASNV